MENIEYNSIVNYIKQDIISQSIYSNSTITNNFLGIGGSTAAQEDKNKTIVLNVMQAIKLDAKTITALKLDQMNFSSPALGIGISSITGLVYILNAQAQFSLKSIIPCIGLLGISLILSKVGLDIGSIVTWITNTIAGITSIGKVLEAINTIVNMMYGTSLGGGGSAFIQTIGTIASTVTTPIYQFAKFLVFFVTEMISRPIISSMINSIKSFISSNGSEELVQNPTFINELTNAFNAALEKARSGKLPNHEILSSFRFNEKTGEIEYLNSSSASFKKITTLISSKPKKIEMNTLPTGKITYLIDSAEISGKSMIEGKPIELALVIAYIQAHAKPTSVTRPSTSNSTYSFSLESDGSVRLFENGKEISTVTRAAKESNPTYIQEVCQNLFGVKDGLGNPTCSTYFYSAIGKSIEGILKTFGGASHDIHGQIISANFGLLYDLVKRLGWTTRYNLRMEYELITVDEWESTSGKQFADYLKKNPQVRNLLVRIVERLNSNPTFLNLRYNYEYSQKQKKRSHFPPKTLILTKMVTLGETLALNKSRTNLTHSGGFKSTHRIEKKYLEMIEILKSYNQKLNSASDEIIRQKIKKIIELETEIENINTNILTYVKMLKSNREIRLDNKIVTLDDIESMLSTQEVMTKTHNKRMLSLSTAFGKLQLLIDTVPLATQNKRQVYHSI